MHRKIWLTLTSLVLMGLIGSLGITHHSVQARHVHRSRINRQVHRHRARSLRSAKIPTSIYHNDLLFYSQGNHTGYTRNYFKIHHYPTQMSKAYINSVVKAEYNEINRARHHIHERPLIQNRELVRLAQWRAKQAHRHFTHYNQAGQPLAWHDAERMRLGSYRYNRRNIGENMFFVGKLSRIKTNLGVAGYYFKNPEDLASDNVFDSLNNDAASQWTHGENIMTPKHRYVGIGTYYQKSNHGLYVLVEFSSRKPVTHKR